MQLYLNSLEHHLALQSTLAHLRVTDQTIMKPDVHNISWPGGGPLDNCFCFISCFKRQPLLGGYNKGEKGWDCALGLVRTPDGITVTLLRAHKLHILCTQCACEMHFLPAFAVTLLKPSYPKRYQSLGLRVITSQ